MSVQVFQCLWDRTRLRPLKPVAIQAPGISHAAVDSPESMRAPMMWHI